MSGLQGRDDPEGQGYLRLVASPKHFVGYDTEGMGPVSSGCVDAGTGQPGTGCTFSGPTFNRHNFTANISAQELKWKFRSKQDLIVFLDQHRKSHSPYY